MDFTNAKLMFEYTLPLRWGDMDALGHVNNSIYFTYCEQVRVDWLNSLSNNLMNSATEGPVLINAECTFLKPIVYPDELLIKLYALAPGNSSFTLLYELASKTTNTLFSQASSKVVWIDKQKGKSKSIPEALRVLLPN